MFTIDPGFVLKLSAELLQGEDSLLRKAIKHKLKQLSVELLNDLTEGEASYITRTGRQAQRGVQKPFNLLRQQWLGGEELTEQSIFEQLAETVEKGGKARIKRRRLDRQGWRQSRQYWLGDDWRHDWRSQPRDWHGRWSPGRLRHPYVSKGARRMRLERRRAARAAFLKMRNREYGD